MSQEALADKAGVDRSYMSGIERGVRNVSVGMVARIYALADLEMTPEARSALEHFVVENPRGRHGRIRYDLKRDFGVDPKELRQRFGFYFDRFPARAEGS